MDITKLTNALENLYNQFSDKQKDELLDNYGADCATDFIKLVLYDIDEKVSTLNLHDLF